MSLLQTTICGKQLDNPTVLASGILGISAATLGSAALAGAGAVTMKSLTLKSRPGHPNPTVLSFGEGIINAVGLANEGIKEATAEIIKYKSENTTPLIVSIAGAVSGEFGEIASLVDDLKPDFIEVNISCPNVENDFGRPFACSIDDSVAVTKKIRKNTQLPLIIKLSPNVTNIADVAKAVEAAGADVICAINTVGPGMLIDINARRPLLSNRVGGVSGPAIKPVAVRCVYDIYRAVKIPIIGTGGIVNAEGAMEMMMAGAVAVGIGSAIYYEGMGAFKKITSGIEQYLKEKNIYSLQEIIGSAHEK